MDKLTPCLNVWTFMSAVWLNRFLSQWVRDNAICTCLNILYCLSSFHHIPILTKTFIYVCNNLLFNINLLIDRVFWISAYLQPLLGLSYEKFIIFMNVLIMRFSVIAQAFWGSAQVTFKTHGPQDDYFVS